MQHISKSANRRLLFRVATVVIVGLLAKMFQDGYERDGFVWMFYMEMILYAVMVVVLLRGHTGRLKSGPDSGAVTSQELFERDPAVRMYIATYLLLLMLGIVAFALLGNEVTTGPWGIFVALSPMFLIIFFRQYRLERRGDTS